MSLTNVPHYFEETIPSEEVMKVSRRHSMGLKKVKKFYPDQTRGFDSLEKCCRDVVEML